MASNAITLEKLSSMFHMPEKAVAAELGMCLTSLKKTARSHGITRWPYRKLKSLERTMQKMSDDQSCLGAIATCIPTPSFPKLDDAVAICRTTPAHKKIGSTHEKDSSSSVRCGVVIAKPQRVWVSDDRSASRRPIEEDEDSEGPLRCIVSGNVLSVENWSVLWTVSSMRQRLLVPLGGSDISFSEDGSRVMLTFTTLLASSQASRVVKLASKLAAESHSSTIISSTSSSSSNSSSSSSSSSEGDEESVFDATEEEDISSGTYEEEADEEETRNAASHEEAALTSHGDYDLWTVPPSSVSRGFGVSPPCSFSLGDRQQLALCNPWSNVTWAC